MERLEKAREEKKSRADLERPALGRARRHPIGVCRVQQYFELAEDASIFIRTGKKNYDG